MQNAPKTPLSITKFIRHAELETRPREDTHTAILYHEYFAYCQLNDFEVASNNLFTRALRRIGYERMSMRIGGTIKKGYRYTGKKETTCPRCQGSGLVLIKK